MLRTTNIWPTIVEWKNKHHAIPFFFAGYKLNLHTNEARELGLVEWVRLPQCGEPKFKSWLEEVPYLVADTPQIGLPPVEETYGKPKKKKNCAL
jgi:hypothetical protein